jgi:3-dehydroquinate synthase
VTDTQIIEVGLTGRAYPIVVGRRLLADLSAHVPLPDSAARVLLVTQEPVIAAGCVDSVERGLRAAGLEVHTSLVPDGERAKSVEVLADLWHTCASMPLTRSDVVVAVGGGVVGDLAGFVAATFDRGIAVVQVPTTLLAQVDAAIGGKTGINLPEGKNLVGAFHQPLGVVCDVAALATLPPRIAIEGLGEVVKYGLIHDPLVLERLEERVAAVGGDAAVGGASVGGAGDGGVSVVGDVDLLHELVVRCAAAKAKVVAADERESGPRAYLNFGHTYGHVVEALTGYLDVLHGEAVAIGMVVALRLGVEMGHTPAELAARGEALIDGVGLPTRGPALDRAAVWATLARDKKAVAGEVRFVVLDGLAAPTVVTPTREAVDAVLDDLAG